MKLHVIGNGFDINHGLNTQYTAYRDFTKRDYSTHLWFDILPYRKHSNRPQDVEYAWGDIESDLALNFLDLLEDSIENRSNDEKNTILENVELYTKRVKEFTTTLLCEWLKTRIETPLERKYILSKKDMYLNFNYTNTLEYFYNIPSNKILHIHGSIKNIDPLSLNPSSIKQEIQFGAPQSIMEKKYAEVNSQYGSLAENDYDLKQGLECIKEYLKWASKDLESNYDKLRKFISKDKIDEIVIMGNRCWGVDFNYYSDVIRPTITDATWTFLYFKEEEIENFLNMCCELNIKKIKVMKWEEYNNSI